MTLVPTLLGNGEVLIHGLSSTQKPILNILLNTIMQLTADIVCTACL